MGVENRLLNDSTQLKIHQTAASTLTCLPVQRGVQAWAGAAQVGLPLGVGRLPPPLRSRPARGQVPGRWVLRK